MRVRFVLVLLALLAAALVPATTPVTPPPAYADCAAPMLDLARDQELPRAGTEVTITGRFFKDGCNDLGSCHGVLGCQSCDYGPPAEPMAGLTLELHQAGRGWDLATADATGEAGKVTWSFEMPRGVRKGAARLTVKDVYAEPARVRIG